MNARESYTIRQDATEDEAASVCRAALVAMWDDLLWFEIDLDGLSDEPGCAEPVTALQGLRPKRLLARGLESSAHLEPGRDDGKLWAALELVGKTIGSTGLSRDHARLVYDANDGGTSCVFDLTAQQYLTALERLREDGMAEHLLIPWSRRR